MKDLAIAAAKGHLGALISVTRSFDLDKEHAKHKDNCIYFGGLLPLNKKEFYNLYKSLKSE